MTSNEQIALWKKKNVKTYQFYVNRNGHPELIDWLDSIPKRQQYLVKLVKEDYEKTAQGRAPEEPK